MRCRECSRRRDPVRTRSTAIASIATPRDEIAANTLMRKCIVAKRNLLALTGTVRVQEVRVARV
jgi:hypothetical protein